MPGNPGSAPRWAASGERPKNIRGTLRRLIGYMGDYRREVYAGIAFSVLSTICSLIGPQYLEAITDEISGAVLGGRDIDSNFISGTAFPKVNLPDCYVQIRRRAAVLLAEDCLCI